MQKTKKFLSALLAVVMIVSVFTFGASAGVTELDPSASENIAMKLEVEHEDGSAANSVSPGETVTVKVYVTAKDAEARVAGGMFLVFFNSDIYTFVEGSRQWGVGGTEGGFISNDALMAINGANDNAYKNTVAQMSEEELAYGWNAAANIQVQNAAGTVNTNAPLIKANAAIPFLTFKLKVSDTVAPGTAAPIGIPVTAIAPLNTARQNYTYIQTWTATNKTLTQNKSRSLYAMDTIANLSVESAEATPVVAMSKSQVLFTGDKSTATPDDAFTYRLTSVVTADDLALMNTNGNSITALGFVAANASNAGTLAEAKAAVEAGTELPSGWKTASTTYISQADATANAYFGARIQNILHSSQLEDISVCAYVAYTNGDVTSYIWYDAAVTAGVSTNYDAAVSAWAQA